MLKTELEKLCRKPALWTGFLLSLLSGLYLIWVMMPVVYTGEEELRGMAAVRYNRSIAAEYEGFLTDGKAEEIIARYGYSRYADDGRCIYGNYLNRFVTENMTDYRNSKERKGTVLYSLKDINNILGRASYADKIYFSYAEGWEALMEVFMGVVIVWGITMTVVLAPVYSSDRSLKTEAVIRASAEGRRKMPFGRLLAGWIIAGGGFLLLGGFLFLLNGLLYGFEGLRSNLLCVGAAPYMFPESVTTGQFWAAVYFPRALLGVTALVILAAGISAVCSRTLTSLCVLAFFFAYPIISRILVFQLGVISLSRPFARLLTFFNEGMPLYLMLPSLGLEGSRGRFFPYMAGFALCLAGLWMLWRGWCRNGRKG